MPQRGRGLPPQQPITRRRLRSIYDLPSNVLVKIFAHMNPGIPYWDNVGKTRGPLHVHRFCLPYWVPLMLVCRRWREAIWNEPKFWRHIDIGRQVRWLELCLRRSGHADLVLSFRDPRVDLAKVMAVMAPHVHRVVTLYRWNLDCGQLQFPLPVFPLSLPRLDKVVLEVLHHHNSRALQRHQATCPTAHISEQSFPKLRSVSLTGVGIAASPALSALRSLSLKNWTGACPAHTLSTFLKTLASCVNLEELTLSNVLASVALTDARGHDPDGLLSLTKLHTLAIHDEVSHISELLPHMHIPAKVKTTLSTTECTEQDIATAAFNMLPPEATRDRTLPILRAVTGIKVAVEADIDASPAVRIIGAATSGPHRGGRLEFVVHLPAQRPANDDEDPSAQKTARAATLRTELRNLELIFPARGNRHLTTLVVYGSVDSMRAGELWKLALAQYPDLRTLVVDDCAYGGDACPIVRGLLPDRKTGAAVAPRLRYLWIRNAVITQDLVRDIEACVEARVARGMPLERLRLELNPEQEPSFGRKETRAGGSQLDTRVFVEKMRRLVQFFDLRIWRLQNVRDTEEKFTSTDMEIPF